MMIFRCYKKNQTTLYNALHKNKDLFYPDKELSLIKYHNE